MPSFSILLVLGGFADPFDVGHPRSEPDAAVRFADRAVREVPRFVHVRTRRAVCP